MIHKNASQGKAKLTLLAPVHLADPECWRAGELFKIQRYPQVVSLKVQLLENRPEEQNYSKKTEDKDDVVNFHCELELNEIIIGIGSLERQKQVEV